MIKLIYMLCAENVIVDTDTNNVSIINVLEEMIPSGLPFVIPHLVLVIQLERDKDDLAEVSTTLKLAVNNEKIAEYPLQIDFLDKKRSRAIVRINNIVIQTNGILAWTLIYETQILSEYKIIVDPPPITSTTS